MQIKPDSFTTLLGNAFFIFLLTASGYLVYYFYKLGFYKYFDIPSYFIDFSLQNLIFVFLATFIFIPLVIRMAYNQTVFVKKVTRINLIRLSCAIIVYGFAYIYIVPPIDSQSLSSNFFLDRLIKLAIGAVLFIVLFCIPWLASVIARWFLSDQNLDSEINNIKLADTPYFFCLLFSSFFVIWMLGFNAADTGTFNTITAGNKTFIVVDESFGNLLLLPINKTTKIVKKELFIYKPEDLNIEKSPLLLNKQIGVSGVTD